MYKVHSIIDNVITVFDTAIAITASADCYHRIADLCHHSIVSIVSRGAQSAMPPPPANSDVLRVLLSLYDFRNHLNALVTLSKHKFFRRLLLLVDAMNNATKMRSTSIIVRPAVPLTTTPCPYHLLHRLFPSPAWSMVIS